MAERKQYVAVAPLVIAKEAQGRDLYAYEGQPISEDATDESIANLLEGGFIEEVEVPADAASDETVPYKKQKVDDLKALITIRNEGREDADKIDDSGNKEALVAALEADDAAHAKATE